LLMVVVVVVVGSTSVGVVNNRMLFGRGAVDCSDKAVVALVLVSNNGRALTIRRSQFFESLHA
jgi:hypothetical protein